jgi:hypothetical protein
MWREVNHGHWVNCTFEVVSESSQTVIVVNCLSERNETEGQGHTSASLRHQSATWRCSMNMNCCYTSAFSTSRFISSAGWQNRASFVWSSVNALLRPLKCFVRKYYQYPSRHPNVPMLQTYLKPQHNIAPYQLPEIEPLHMKSVFVRGLSVK